MPCSFYSSRVNFNRLEPSKTDYEFEDDYKPIQYGTTKATSPTVAFAQSQSDSRLIYEQLDALSKDPKSKVSHVQSLYSLIPTEQSERIKWVKKLCRTLRRKVKLFKGDALAGGHEILKHCQPQAFAEKDLPEWVRKKFTDQQGQVANLFL